MDFLQSNTAQGKVEQISPKKRSEPEDTEMDIKKPETSKKKKVSMGTEIIDIDMIKELVITPTIIQEEVSQTIVENTTVNPEESSKLSSIPVLQYKKYNYAADAKDQFKNKQNLLAHYIDQRKESVVQAHKQLNELIKKSDEKVTLMTVRDSATGSLSLAITDDEKASEIRLEMDQLSAPDKIWFHKQASEVLYADLTRETLALKKAVQRIEKLEAHLKQEKAANKAWSTQVAHLQTELASYKELPPVQGAETQPAAKVTTVKTVKKRGKAVNVNVDTSPSPILVKLHEEIAGLNAKAVEDNAKLLVLQEHKEALEKEKGKLLQEIEQLNSNRETSSWSPIDQITHDIADMSVHEAEIEKFNEKVSDLENTISELKHQIEEIKAQDPREQEIINLKEDNDKLKDKNHKLKEKTKGVLPLEGAKHLLWDELIEDIHAFRPQLMIVEEHEKALGVASNRCKLAEEKLINRTQEVAQNAINFLSKAPASELQILKVSNMTVLLVDARRVLQKYTLLNAVRGKMSQIQKQVQEFKQAFLPLSGYGLPSFWDNENMLIAGHEYK